MPILYDTSLPPLYLVSRLVNLPVPHEKACRRLSISLWLALASHRAILLREIDHVSMFVCNECWQCTLGFQYFLLGTAQSYGGGGGDPMHRRRAQADLFGSSCLFMWLQV